MTEYIIDTSILVQHLIQDTHTKNVQTLFRGLAKSDDLYIPEFCLLECTNVLWKQVRFHNLPQAHAERQISVLLRLPLSIVPLSPYFKRALQIGLLHQLAIYDSVYIAWRNN